MVNRQIARLSNPERQRVFNELNESTLSGEKIRLEFAKKTFYETAAEEGCNNGYIYIISITL